MAGKGGDRAPATSEVVVGALERFGFKTAFGMPGMWSISLYEALRESRIRHVLVRHEEFAAYAADGYARASGKPGLCMGTAGPGAINIAAGLAVPFRDHSPVLAITGQVPTEERGMGWIEDMDLQSVFTPVTKSTAEASSLNAYDCIASAYLSALEGCPGPAHVSIPGDVQRSPSRGNSYVPAVPRPEPDPQAVEAALESISGSSRPLILAGWGAVLSGASEGVARLAEALPSHVATSYMGRGAIPEDHPLALGPAGRRGTAAANSALTSSDLIISLGCRLSNLTLYRSKVSAKVIHVDVEEKNFSPRASLRVKSDTSAFVDALLPRLKPMGRKTLPAREPEPPHGPQPGALGFARAIASAGDAIFSVDIGQHTIWLMQSLLVRKPRHTLISGNMSAMGFSLPAAIGAKLACPDEKVVAVMGDGGFQMTAGELSTIKENGLAIAVCVFNNRSLGLIRQLQESVYGKAFGVDYPCPPDYVKMAESCHVRGVRAGSPSDVTEALRRFDEPVVIEIPVPAREGIEMATNRITGEKG
jgi:acetolactate synthase-1/2/3 large subunit